MTDTIEDALAGLPASVSRAVDPGVRAIESTVGGFFDWIVDTASSSSDEGGASRRGDAQNVSRSMVPRTPIVTSGNFHSQVAFYAAMLGPATGESYSDGSVPQNLAPPASPPPQAPRIQAPGDSSDTSELPRVPAPDLTNTASAPRAAPRVPAPGATSAPRAAPQVTRPPQTAPRAAGERRGTIPRSLASQIQRYLSSVLPISVIGPLELRGAAGSRSIAVTVALRPTGTVRSPWNRSGVGMYSAAVGSGPADQMNVRAFVQGRGAGDEWVRFNGTPYDATQRSNIDRNVRLELSGPRVDNGVDGAGS